MVDFSQVFHKPAKKAVRCCEKNSQRRTACITNRLIIKTLCICRNLLASPRVRSSLREAFYVCLKC